MRSQVVADGTPFGFMAHLRIASMVGDIDRIWR